MKLEDFKEQINELLNFVIKGKVEHFTLVLSNAQYKYICSDDDPEEVAVEKLLWLGENGLYVRDFKKSKITPDGYQMEVKRDMTSKNNIVTFTVEY